MISIAKTSILLLLFAVSLQRIAGDSNVAAFYGPERDDLIVLRESLTATLNLHSNWTGPPCHFNRSKWIGITCSDSHVIGVALDGIQLTGSLQPTALQNLTFLANLSMSNNALRGGLPTLKGLIYLQTVSFSRNRFSGSIPAGYVALPRLSQIELEDNLLNGTIPPFQQQSLDLFNVSYNFLQGRIPETSVLQRLPGSCFDHNLELCGKPLDKPCPEAPPPAPLAPLAPLAPPGSAPVPSSPSNRSHTKGLHLWSLVLVAVGAAMAPFMILLCFLCYYKRYHKRAAAGRGYNSGEPSSEITEKAARGSGSQSEPERMLELVFFDKQRPVFDLDDLLRASAEVMGKGKTGASYRATLEAGWVMVVKRLRDMGGLSRKDFVQQMQLIGRMRHENLVEIISFYYSKDEKLVIYEYVPHGSLMQLLHENRGEGRVPLRWAARLAIAKGVARGLAYLHHSLPSHKVPHGNLKSSNVLILRANRDYHPKLTDFGFLPLLPSQPQSRKLAIAKTPEFSQGKKLTHKADIYCFGLLLLEIITGQMPGENEDDLPGWVRSVISNDWSTDVLDLEIVAEEEGHAEMLRLTEIALQCTASDPQRRPKMSELVKRIDEIRGESDGESSLDRT